MVMAHWKPPPINKVYEALGAIADGRLELEGNNAICRSSSGNKVYAVSFDPASNAVSANDNGSYWQNYLGYPSIALLLAMGVLDYRPEMAELIRGIKWKDVNRSFRNDHARALESVLQELDPLDREALAAYVAKLQDDIAALNPEKLPRRLPPPKGY